VIDPKEMVCQYGLVPERSGTLSSKAVSRFEKGEGGDSSPASQSPPLFFPGSLLKSMLSDI